MRNRFIVLVAVAGLLTVSGIAAASEEEKEDTVFNFGYDSESGVLIWNLSPNDGLYDCTLQNGPLNTTYSLSPDGLVYVDGITDGSDMTVAFQPRTQEELAEGLVAAEEPVEYSGAEGECGLSGGSVAGPNGQVNHGMFMKLFNSVFDGPARGCVVRHLAQSDLGKGDQQVQAGDVDPDAESVADGDTGIIEFDTVITDCLHERDEQLESEEDSEEGGKPEWAGSGKPPWAGNGKPPWAGNSDSDEGSEGDSGRGKPPWAGGPGGPGGPGGGGDD